MSGLPMNIWVEVDALPRRSQIALAAALLRAAKPSVKELAEATGVCNGAVRNWLDIQERNFPQPLSASRREFPE